MANPTFFALIFFCITSMPCRAQDDDIIVSFVPSGNLSIGKSIDINNPNATKQDVLATGELEWLDGGSTYTALKASLVSNTNELHEKMNLNANMKGEVKLPVIGGGKTEYDLKHQIEKDYNDNNLYYVIEAHNDFGRQELKGVKLKKEFQNLLDSHKYDEFISFAGTHFVKRQRRASVIYALITISKLSSITKKSLDLTYNNSTNINISKVADVSGEQTLQFKRFISTANKMASVKLEYYSSGTAGLSKLTGAFPQSPDDLVSILKALSQATESVTRDNSKPIEYHLVSFHAYGLSLPPFDRDKNECLSKLTDRRLIIGSYLNKVQKTLASPVNSNFKNYYSKKHEYLNLALKAINRIEKDCKTKNICCQSTDKDESIIWLEDIVTVNKTYVVPDYIAVYNSDGIKAGKIIKSLTLLVEGTIENDEYYSSMNSYYLDDGFNPVKTNVKLVGNTNPSLSNPADKEGYFLKRDFVYIVDITNIDYEYNSNSQVIYNNVNLDKSQAAVNSFRNKNYFIEVQSRDNLKHYVDLGLFNFNTVQTLARQ
ncbi:hypothetical protein [Hymenobacter sp. YC55]|uniref:hypothetical protein n=1 Tax=Hymenobacter sp. YC55 TaxID=3034019 RepID=UPI0023F72A8C|nr:hypothetical protein [Hymenobacter sp. YC55]MDF7815727.1 hypothetical protein [Hymenobacter sp. YC55]